MSLKFVSRIDITCKFTLQILQLTKLSLLTLIKPLWFASRSRTTSSSLRVTFELRSLVRSSTGNNTRRRSLTLSRMQATSRPLLHANGSIAISLSRIRTISCREAHTFLSHLLSRAHLMIFTNSHSHEVYRLWCRSKINLRVTSVNVNLLKLSSLFILIKILIFFK